MTSKNETFLKKMFVQNYVDLKVVV